MKYLVPIASFDIPSERHCGRSTSQFLTPNKHGQRTVSKAGVHCAAAVAFALAVAGCSNGQTGLDGPNLTVEPAATDTAASEPSATDPAETAPPAPQEIADLPDKPPVPTISPNEVVKQAPKPETVPASVPAPTPRESVETTVLVAEKPVSKVENIEVVETAELVIERIETVETTEVVIDQTKVDAKAGIAVEQVEVIERTEKTVDTVEIDKATGTAVETIVKSKPVEKETETVTVAVESTPMAPDGPRDAARLFTGPGQIEPSDYSGYGVFAIRLDAPASDRDRLVMLCDAFVAPSSGKQDPAGESEMVTVWPIATTDRSDALNASSGGKQCENAVEHYAGAVGQEAIADSERTGWILDNAGPYLLAWAPPSDKGISGASVLLVDLSSVNDPGQARNIMRHWSEDVERNDMLWSVEGWNPEELSRVINDWRGEFGPRTILLLGTAGG